ncbi:ZCHC3 protein, partial [Polyodon spathula]|nr:ZCHC3 protein [Polyodon spathula]
LFVFMYNPYVGQEDVAQYIGRVCDIISGPFKVLDPVGIWTGKWKFFVRLKICSTKEGGIVHPPGQVQIGGNRGFLSYPGQPRRCFKCDTEGHEANECQVTFCQKCRRKGHEAMDCNTPKSCSMCGSLDHLYREC